MKFSWEHWFFLDVWFLLCVRTNIKKVLIFTPCPVSIFTLSPILGSIECGNILYSTRETEKIHFVCLPTNTSFQKTIRNQNHNYDTNHKDCNTAKIPEGWTNGLLCWWSAFPFNDADFNTTCAVPHLVLNRNIYCRTSHFPSGHSADSSIFRIELHSRGKWRVQRKRRALPAEGWNDGRNGITIKWLDSLVRIV